MDSGATLIHEFASLETKQKEVEFQTFGMKIN